LLFEIHFWCPAIRNSEKIHNSAFKISKRIANQNWSDITHFLNKEKYFSYLVSASKYPNAKHQIGCWLQNWQNFSHIHQGFHQNRSFIGGGVKQVMKNVWIPRKNVLLNVFRGIFISLRLYLPTMRGGGGVRKIPCYSFIKVKQEILLVKKYSPKSHAFLSSWDIKMYMD
jgi:hypothetical protein